MASKNLKDTHTVKDVIANIMDGWTLRKWFSWPPDVFLMTSYVLKKTGAYRNVVNECDWRFEEIPQLEILSDEWVEVIQLSLISNANKLVLPKDIEKRMIELEIFLQQRLRLCNYALLKQ